MLGNSTHSLDVLARGHVRLAGHETTVAILAHTQCVGQFDPLDCINIDRKVPGMDLLWAYAQQQSEEPGDHQALDVVCIAVL